MIETKQSHLKIKADSHPGLGGKQNEDRYRICSCQLSPKDKTASTLAVLCDGIGGHKAGEVAAQMGVNIITETILEGDAKKPLEIIQKAIVRASEAIYQTSLTNQGPSGMGATAAIAWIIKDHLYTANLGDSRIYLLRDGHIIQLTTDHTWVQEAFEEGLIDEADRMTHPNAHVIRRYLGAKNAPKPDFRMWYFEGESDSEALKNQGLRLKDGDTILLCSDGLTDLVGDREIHEVVKNNTLDAAVEKLIGISNARGGHDNITVILMNVPSTGVFNKSKKQRVFKGCLYTLIILSALITIITYGWRWWRNRLENIEFSTPGVTYPVNVGTDEFLFTETTFPEFTQTPTVQQATSFPTLGPTITPWPTNTIEP